MDNSSLRLGQSGQSGWSLYRIFHSMKQLQVLQLIPPGWDASWFQGTLNILLGETLIGACLLVPIYSPMLLY